MKYTLTALLVLLAVQAQAQSQVDPGLRELPQNTAANHPPTASSARYTVAGTELATPASGATVQKLPVGALQAGRSYTLAVRASGKGSVAVRFREPKQQQTYRTYATPVDGSTATDYTVEFTAPAYTDLAEIALQGQLGVERVSLKMRPALPRTEPVKDWGESFTPPGYQLVFNDEFNGTALDRRRWFTRYINGNETTDRLNDENQRYTDKDNHVESDGLLRLVARRKELSQPNGLNYESGMIRSDFTLRYGFLEARVKMPGGRGVWPAFWMISDVGETGRINWPPEIDIFEFVNNVENDKVNKIHIAANVTPKGSKPVWLYTAPGMKPAVNDWVAPFDFDKGWHTIAVEWTPERVGWYVDGQNVASRLHSWTYDDGVLASPAHILLNFAVGGAWAGRHGIDDSAFPQSLDIDWVRVYQKPPAN